MSKNYYLAVACTLLVLAGGLYYFFRSEPATPPRQTQEAKSDSTANITFTGNSIVEQQNGHKKWELTAESSQVDPSKNQLFLNKFKGTLYKDDGGTIILTAPKARMDLKNRNIFLDGNIKAVSSDGTVFLAAKAEWSAKEQHFYGSGGITISRGDTVITGDKIDSDAKLEKVKVQGNAHAIKGGVPQ